MKALFTFVFVFALALSSAFAQWSGRNPSRRQVTCSASDRGWEEHFGGHRDCGSCLAKHNECVETCSIQSYVCQAKGTTAQGRYILFTGQGQNRFEAESEARRRCEWNRNVRSCYITSCSTRSTQVSRRSCR